MTTMKEVNDATERLAQKRKLGAVTDEEAYHILRLIVAVGDAICEEQGCSSFDVSELPDETVLGPRAESLFKKLQGFINS